MAVSTDETQTQVEEEMEEEAEEEVAESPKPTAKSKAKGKGKAKSKGKGKAKAKGKGKAKAKSKAKARVVAEPVEVVDEGEAEAEPPKPKAKAKAKAKSKNKGMPDIGDKTLEEAVEEAQKRISDLEAEVSALSDNYKQLVGAVQESAKDLQAATAKVEDIAHREAHCLEKMKAAKLRHAEVTVAALKARQEQIDNGRTVKVLELENERGQKVVDLEEAKRVAQEAVEAAKKAVENSKAREKEAQQALRDASKDQGEVSLEAVRGIMQMSEETQDTSLPVATQISEKQTQKALHAELAEIEKKRQLRDKERQKMRMEASAMGKGKAKGKARPPLEPPPGGSPPAKRLAGESPNACTGEVPATARAHDVD